MAASKNSRSKAPTRKSTRRAKAVRPRSEVVFNLNGELLRVGGEEASMMLADYLRRHRQLTGTKIVCAEGDCGACTVLKAAPFESGGKKARYLPVNSCIIPVASLDGSRVVTVDGMKEGEKLHPVQKAMVDCHGSQCGFCTPGFVMAIAGLVEKRIDAGQLQEPISEKEAKNSLTANLCRCTGYSPILNAACSVDLKACKSVRERNEEPADLKQLRDTVKTPLLLDLPGFRLFAPAKLSEATAFLKKNAGTALLSGSTDLGVVHNKRKRALKDAISLHLIPELYKVRKIGKSKLHVGARVTLSEVRDFVKDALIPEFADFLDLFASPQIKNQATLVGNLANASPIGDTPPFLLVAGTVVHTLGTTGGRRRVPIEQFFVGYRKTALKPGEFITGVEFDIPSKDELLRLRKVSQRKDLDISTVNAAFRLKLERNTLIREARIAFGGIAATPLRLAKTEALLQGASLADLGEGKPLRQSVVDSLQSEIAPIGDLRSSAPFRRVTAENLMLQFLREITP